MIFPLSFWDISLLLAITAIVMLISSEMLSTYYGKVSVFINKRKLKNAATVVSTLFLATVAIRILGIVLSP